jgi:hypothetical protein
MRSLLFAALAIAAGAAGMTFKTTPAEAVVYCAAGVVRAGCVARPTVTARGVARRTARRTVRRNI